MSRLDVIRAAIVAHLGAIPDIGKVFDHEPYVLAVNGLAALYTVQINGASQLRGWFVRRTATRESSPALGRHVETHTWHIRGYMALSEERNSELAFDALIDAIRDAFRADENLGGAVQTTVVDDAAGVQLEESAPVMFAGVLCHAANLSLVTRHNL